MKIAEFGTLQMARTNAQHFGTGQIQSKFNNLNDTESSAYRFNMNNADNGSFRSYLLDAVNTVNSQQMDVSSLQEKLITNPDEVDVHDVTIAMSKARMSLNLAQTVIDRLVTDWNEISTTR